MTLTPELIAMAKALEDERDRILEEDADGLPLDLEKIGLRLAHAALSAIREIDDGVKGDGPLAKAIAVVEDYYDDKWSITVASESWTAAVNHILGETKL